MSTVAMDIIFEGKMAETLRDYIEQVVIEAMSENRIQAKAELTFWEPSKESLNLQ